MSDLKPADVRTFLKKYLGQKLEASGRGAPEELHDDCDLLLSGLVGDSLGFVDLLLAIEEFVGREIDFDTLDPEEMSIVGRLCSFVTEQTSKAN